MLWILLYVNCSSLADLLSRSIGVEKLFTFPVHLLLCLLLFTWLRRNGLMAKFGLCRPKLDARSFLWYIPLGLIVSCNAWFGLQMNMSMGESLLYLGSMLCVGFLEEVIFRGLLFKAICSDSLKSAVIISSLSFAVGHIVNLFNGSGMALVSNICQIFYAFSAGLLFVLIFLRSGSLLPCIACHSALNALSTFAIQPELSGEILSAVLLCIICLVYALYIRRITSYK